jgi:hypothetical protein
MQKTNMRTNTFGIGRCHIVKGRLRTWIPKTESSSGEIDLMWKAAWHPSLQNKVLTIDVPRPGGKYMYQICLRGKFEKEGVWANGRNGKAMSVLLGFLNNG